MRGTHWTSFQTKENILFNFDGFGSSRRKFLQRQLTKAITFHEYKTQDINSRLCRTYSSNLIYLIKRMDYYNAFFKTLIWLLSCR